MVGVLSLTPSFSQRPKAPCFCSACMCVQVAGSSVPGISQATILTWLATSFSRRSSRPRGWTHISCTGKQILYHYATWEALFTYPQKPHLTEESYAGTGGLKSLRTTSSNVLSVWNFSFSSYYFLFLNLPLEDLLTSSEPNYAKTNKQTKIVRILFLFFFFSSRKSFYFRSAHGFSFCIW